MNHKLPAEQAGTDADPFRPLYLERADLLALLAAVLPMLSAQFPAVTSVNDPNYPGWPVLYLYLPTGQVSWHIAPADAHLFTHVPQVPGDDVRARWDGHTTGQKTDRIRQAVALISTYWAEISQA